MPVYKVTMTETDIKAIVAYVEAADADAAEDWAARIEDGDAVGRTVSVIGDLGTVEDIEEVEAVPPGYRLNAAE